MPKGAAAVLAAFLLVGASARADDRPQLYFGLGGDDINNKHSQASGALVEVGSKTFGWRDRFRWRAALMVSGDRDVWIGAGLSFNAFERGPWFLELSFLPGVFWRDNVAPNEETVHAPQFRSQVALGYRFNNGTTLSLTASHSSNGKFDNSGSSTEAIMLRYGIPLGQ